MIKSSNFIQRIKRLAVGGNAITEFKANGLMRAVESDIVSSNRRVPHPLSERLIFRVRNERSFMTTWVVPQDFRLVPLG